MNWEMAWKIWKIKMFAYSVVCFFLGHDERRGDRLAYEPDYCDRCFREWPQDLKTMHTYLNRTYCWLVERDWTWFERLDSWLIKNVRLPSWWEY